MRAASQAMARMESMVGVGRRGVAPARMTVRMSRRMSLCTGGVVDGRRTPFPLADVLRNPDPRCAAFLSSSLCRAR